MTGINQPGKHPGPSARTSLPTAWWHSVVKIKPFRLSLSAIGRWGMAADQVNQNKRSAFDLSASQMSRNITPVVRQFLLLFGEGDEASPPAFKGDLLARAESVQRGIPYDITQNRRGIC